MGGGPGYLVLPWRYGTSGSRNPSPGLEAHPWSFLLSLLAPALSEGWGEGLLREHAGQQAVYISAELLDAVSQAAQKYQALYMGTLPVTKAMGED